MKFFIYLLLPLLNTYSTQAANMAWQEQSVACFKTEQDSVDVSNTQKSTTIICEVFIQNKNTLYKVTFRDIYAGPHKELIFISKENSFYGHSLIKGEAKFNTQLNLGLLTEQKILSNKDISYFKKTFLIKHKTEIENIVSKMLKQIELTTLSSGSELLAPGTYIFEAAKSPFNAYWWPMENAPIANGTDSPLGKINAFMQQHRIEGTPSNWEKQNHNHIDDWAGHCNGWAAASILYNEPKTSLRDLDSNITFQIKDLKALLVENAFCVSYFFYGKRYYTSNDNPKDISPALFHQVLVHYLRDQKKPVVFDIKPLEEVYNHVISAATFTIREGSPLRVTVKVKLHSYDSNLTNSTGIAPSETRTYEYLLPVEDNSIQGEGTWISTNPDFIWVPIATKDCNNGRENPHIKDSLVKQIMALPRE